MFTLIGSLILIFKELRSFRSEGLKVYLNFPALSRETLTFFFAGTVRKHNPLINSKTPVPCGNRGFLMVSLTMSYFHWKYNQLSSAIRCFTVLFGMGRSGTTSLWSSGKGFARENHPVANALLGQKQSSVAIHWLRSSLDDIQSKKLHGYRIKLHEQLVMVSWMPRSTYTPILSTSWSRTTL